MLLGVLLATGAAAVTVHEMVVKQREAFAADVDVSYVPPPEHLRLMSLGYREALADLVWVRALIFSGERIGETDVDAVSRYVDAITGLSPRLHRAYLWGGITVVYGGTGGAIGRPQVDTAIEIYRRGLQQFPESHQLLYPFGMLLTHQVASTPGYTEAEKQAAREEGIEMIRKAAAFGADPLVRKYAATLVSDHATEQLAIQFLEAQLAQTEDEGYRRLLRRKLSQLGADATFEAVERTRTEFTREHLERAPYVPDTVWAVIRPEPSPLAVGN